MADIHRDKHDGRETVTLSGDLTVLHSAAVAQALREAVRDASSVEIVIGEVTAIDVTFAQSICAVHRAAASLHKELAVRGEGQEAVANLLRSAGFLRHIGCQDNTRKSCFWLGA